MCGRFSIPDNQCAMMKTFDIESDIGNDTDWTDLMPMYNVAPTDQIPVIYVKDDKRCVREMRWGLIPIRTANIRGKVALNDMGKSINTPINARAETVHSLKSFKRSFEKRRCLIPAGGFYEWRKWHGLRLPYWISLIDRSWLGFAGVYNWWKSPDGEWVPSCTIITTVPNDVMRPIHDRMPVILTESAYDRWLDPENLDLLDLKKVLLPYPGKEMQLHPVSDLVNKPKNNGPGLIEPLVTKSTVDWQQGNLFNQ